MILLHIQMDCPGGRTSLFWKKLLRIAFLELPNKRIDWRSVIGETFPELTTPFRSKKEISILMMLQAVVPKHDLFQLDVISYCQSDPRNTSTLFITKSFVKIHWRSPTTVTNKQSTVCEHMLIIFRRFGQLMDVQNEVCQSTWL